MYHNAIFFLSLFIDVICDKRRTKITRSRDTHLHFKIQEPISHMLLHATINVCFTLFTHSDIHIHTFSIPFHLNNYIFKCNPLGLDAQNFSTILKYSLPVHTFAVSALIRGSKNSPTLSALITHQQMGGMYTAGQREERGEGSATHVQRISQQRISIHL